MTLLRTQTRSSAATASAASGDDVVFVLRTGLIFIEHAQVFTMYIFKSYIWPGIQLGATVQGLTNKCIHSACTLICIVHESKNTHTDTDTDTLRRAMNLKSDFKPSEWSSKYNTGPTICVIMRHFAEHTTENHYISHLSARLLVLCRQS